MLDIFSYKFYKTTIEAWEAMLKSIAVAEKSVYWEIYTLVDDEVGNKFIDLLCEKAKNGLDVKVVIDALGSFGLSRLAVNRMRAAGIELLVFNPLGPSFHFSKWMARVWHRTHRKILLIDEKKAFLGGVNIYQTSSDWYDLHLELSGQVIKPLLRHFAKVYVRAGGSRKKVKRFLNPHFLKNLEELKEKVNFVLNSPVNFTGRSPFRSFYHKALVSSKENFNLLTPYYAPDRKFLQTVEKAKSKGVKINILMPWRSDIRLMQYMAKAFYGMSAKAGASFYFLRRMNHGKAVTSDETMGMVGSVNFTPRSFFINQEVGAVIKDKEMIVELNSILDKWKEEADPLLEMNFKRQGWYKRFRGWWVKKFRDYV